MPQSHSATNLNTYQLGSDVPGKTTDESQAAEKREASQPKRRKSTGGKMSKRQGADQNDAAYSYVSFEVEWALGRHRKPAKSPKLDSSSEEEDFEVEQPLYEHVSVDDLLYA